VLNLSSARHASQQAGWRKSGSKLPHSKASQTARLTLWHHFPRLRAAFLAFTKARPTVRVQMLNARAHSDCDLPSLSI
jgi:hypothetical protein